MLHFKRFGKVLVCLALCLACLLAANPVSAVSTNSAPENDAVPLVENESQSLRVSYVRYSPYKGALIIGCMAEGTVLKVLDSKNSFYKIDCYDMVGYIAKSQVEQNEAGEYVIRTVSGSRDTADLPTFGAEEAIQMRKDLEQEAKKYIGIPYVFGGTTPRGFDCSGYTQYVFRKIGVEVNRTAANQASNGIVVAREDLQPGDLVIFSNTDGNRFGTHIGIYLGNDQVIHSGASKGICIVDLNSTYFNTHFECARRVILTESSATAGMPSVGSITGNIGAGWRNEG